MFQPSRPAIPDTGSDLLRRPGSSPLPVSRMLRMVSEDQATLLSRLAAQCAAPGGLLGVGPPAPYCCKAFTLLLQPVMLHRVNSSEHIVSTRPYWCPRGLTVYMRNGVSSPADHRAHKVAQNHLGTVAQ